MPLILLALLACGAPPAADAPPLVFAAASTTEALRDVTAAFAARPPGIAPTVSVAASSTLARQIQLGAPAALFLSANVDWVDVLEREDHVAPANRSALLTNRLVIAGPPGPRLDPGAGPEALTGCLAMGDPAHVPAGIYGREALTALGWWAAIERRVVPSADVRGALALVERGECSFGVVYATDLPPGGGVVERMTFPAGSHRQPTYELALVGAAPTRAARDLYDFMRGPEAARIFSAHRFQIVRGA